MTITQIELTDGHFWELDMSSTGVYSKAQSIDAGLAPFVVGILAVDPHTGADYNLDAFKGGKTMQELHDKAIMYGVVESINMKQSFSADLGWVPSKESILVPECKCDSRDLLFFGCKCGGWRTVK